VYELCIVTALSILEATEGDKSRKNTVFTIHRTHVLARITRRWSVASPPKITRSR